MKMAKPLAKVCHSLASKIERLLLQIVAETLVGTLAMDETMQEGQLGTQLRTIFADKPDNCAEMPKEELMSLVMSEVNQGNEVSTDAFYENLDGNGDGIFTCSGT